MKRSFYGAFAAALALIFNCQVYLFQVDWYKHQLIVLAQTLRALMEMAKRT